MSNYIRLYTQLALLEIATIKQYPECAKLDVNNFVTGVDYAKAYAARLKNIIKFNQVTWNESPYKEFSILKERPAKRLQLLTDGSIDFEQDASLSVEDWGQFLRSFSQVRNNLVHGAKFLISMGLEQRDDDLISAALSFIEFLQSTELIKHT